MRLTVDLQTDDYPRQWTKERVRELRGDGGREREEEEEGEEEVQDSAAILPK